MAALVGSLGAVVAGVATGAETGAVVLLRAVGRGVDPETVGDAVLRGRGRRVVTGGGQDCVGRRVGLLVAGAAITALFVGEAVRLILLRVGATVGTESSPSSPDEGGAVTQGGTKFATDTRGAMQSDPLVAVGGRNSCQPIGQATVPTGARQPRRILIHP